MNFAAWLRGMRVPAPCQRHIPPDRLQTGGPEKRFGNAK
jgi:hypothetical protein